MKLSQVWFPHSAPTQDAQPRDGIRVGLMLEMKMSCSLHIIGAFSKQSHALNCYVVVWKNRTWTI